MATRIRSKNTGTITKRNGRYRAQVSTPNGDRTGNTFATKAEAEKWIRDQQQKLDQGFDFQGSKTTLAEYLPAWLETRKVDLRAKTACHYSQVTRKHILPKIGNIALKDLSLARIEKFYSDLIQSGVGTRTIRICHNILHKSLEKAVRYGYITHNPAHGAALPRYKHSEMKVLDQAQVGHFLVAIQSSPNRALYHLAITTGMRLGELFGLKWSDLQWMTGALHIQRQVQRVPGQGWSFVEPKTNAGRRTIVVCESALQVLQEHQACQNELKEKVGERWQENDLIFPNGVGAPGDPSNLRKDFQQTLTNAGLPIIRFHDLRHTAASLLLNNKGTVIAVSKMLGHSKSSITLDIYGHLYNESQVEVAEIMNKLVTPIPVELPQKAEKSAGQ
jgi:integrase